MAIKSICKIPGCEKQKYAHGWCKRHYYDLRCVPQCEIEGCTGRQRAKRLCAKHYQRFRKYGSPDYTAKPQGELTEWLLRHVAYRGSDCIIWPYNGGNGRYPTVNFRGQMMNACHAMCILVNGDHPENGVWHAAHSCGNGPNGCLNPNHIAWKTPVENAADKLLHGTHGRGEKNASSKLSRESVLEIRRLSDLSIVSQKEIAKRFSVSQATVSDIKCRRRWAWL